MKAKCIIYAITVASIWWHGVTIRFYYATSSDHYRCIFIEVLALFYSEVKVNVTKENDRYHLTFATRSTCFMATRRFTVEEAVFDDDFGLSD